MIGPIYLNKLVCKTFASSLITYVKLITITNYFAEKLLRGLKCPLLIYGFRSSARFLDGGSRRKPKSRNWRCWGDS